MTLESMSDEEILHIANPIMDNLMDASTAIDHARHIRDFSERMKTLVTTEYLPKVCEKYQREKGYFSRREPVAVFNVRAQWRLSGSSGSLRRLVNSSPKCSSSKKMAHSWSIT